ncbi:MAG: uncharacterized protein JWR45_3802 [Blastococcus sp.]|jgi:hypothetical protein|nr:uncharacterized protein [Blastococcus sp.]
MPQYLLTVFEPTGGVLETEALAVVMKNVAEVDQEMREAGVWVFAGGLHSPDAATVLRPEGGDVLLTDGPYAEGKEHVGGFSIIEAPDLDVALEWGRKLARATTLPIEVRPFR